MAVHSRFLFVTRGLIPSAEAVFLRNCGGGKKKRAEANESKKQASRHSRLNYITGDFVLMTASPPSNIRLQDLNQRAGSLLIPSLS